MSEQKKRVGAVASSTHSHHIPQSCGVSEQTNYTPPPPLCQSSGFSGIASELEKAWLWSALPDDWRDLSSPLDRVLSAGVVGQNLASAGFDDLVQDFNSVPEPGCGLLSNVAKVHAPVFPPPPPVVGVQIYSNDIRLVRAASPARGGGPRGKCEEISAASLKNAKFVIANSEPNLHSLIACTYPASFPVDGRIVKAHHRALLERIRRKFGGFSYFTAFEYQKRGAPHFHMAISFDLAAFGEVVSLSRGAGMGRRCPKFLTVLDLNRWLFGAWLDIISQPGEVVYKGEALDWSGLSLADVENMRTAFYVHNSGVAWEVMRDDAGARHYMVKELSGLKHYQKIVPDGFEAPGRHFLYSRDMRPGDPVQEFVAGDSEVREILEALSWPWMPREGRPLNKTIWNVAASVVIELLERGYKPCSAGGSSLDALRKFDDLRMVEFVGGSDLYSHGTVSAWFNYAAAVVEHWNLKRKLLQKEAEWLRIFSDEDYVNLPTRGAAGWPYCPLIL